MKNNILVRLAIYLVIIILLFAIYNNDKNNIMVESNLKLGGFIEAVMEKYPKLTLEELMKGLNKTETKLDLKSYGIYENQPIIELTKRNHRSFIHLGLAFVAIIGLFEIYEFWQRKKSKNKVQAVIKDIENIANGIYDLDLVNEDSDFSIMQNQLYKFAAVLKAESTDAQAKQILLKDNLEDISHQIKTPLASINLLLDNLEDDSLDNEIKRELIHDIKSQTDAITNLVLMLLKISSLESKLRPFFRKEINVRDLVDHAITILKPEIDQRQIVFDFSIANASFYGDFNWEKEVFVNLIKNAIEHGSDHKVTIKATDTKTYLQVDVINAGEEIPRENLIRIFDRFFKISNNDSNFGIGLNLCKLIVEEDNGKISAHSKGGVNTFRIKYFKSNTF